MLSELLRQAAMIYDTVELRMKYDRHENRQVALGRPIFQNTLHRFARLRYGQS